MQVSIVFVLLVAVLSCKAAVTKPSYSFPEDKNEEILSMFLECMADKGMDYKSDIMANIKKGKYLDDDRTVEIIFCAYERLGYQTKEGQYNIEKIMADLFPTKPEVRPILEECHNNYPMTTVENMKSFFSCFKERVPFKVML